MGSFCSRRKAVHQEDNDWLLIECPARQKNPWRQAIKKVIRLLLRRQIWSQLGKWLRKPVSRTSGNRPVLAAFWHAESERLKMYSKLFSHLVREEGVLKYKARQ